MGCGCSKSSNASDPAADDAQRKELEAVQAQEQAAEEAQARGEAELKSAPAAVEAARKAAEEGAVRERRAREDKRLTCAIVGPPGSIKGKLCELVTSTHAMKHVSGGEALRDAMKAGSDAGRAAQEARKDTGQVPEALQIEIVGALLMSDALLDCGWLLDGLPRTKAQASALKATGARLTRLIVVDVSDEELVKRATGRRIDPVTHTLYHMEGMGFPFPPDDPEITERLTQRRDDTEERVRERLDLFRAGNEDVETMFDQVLHLDGSLEPEALMPQIAAFLGVTSGPAEASAGTPPL